MSTFREHCRARSNLTLALMKRWHLMTYPRLPQTWKIGKTGKVRGKCKKVWNFEICSQFP